MSATDPKQRILSAALGCFAAKGYAATTMADIEAAAGFVPRTGGTYRHFRSKRAILEAAVEAELDRSDEAIVPRTSMEEVAREGLAELDRQRDLMRVLVRELDEFPDLLARVRQRLVEEPYRRAAQLTRLVAPDIDADAVVAVFLGALVNYKLIEHLVGVRPGGVDEDRFVSTWARLFEDALGSAAR